MARYGKHLGGPFWFKTHQFLQIAAVAFTIIAAIIISQVIGEKTFKDLSDDKSPSKDHVNAGLAVCVFAVVQVLLGMLRNVISGEHTEEHKHGERRWIFNWTHRTNGWMLFGLATYAVYKGVTLFPSEAQPVDGAMYYTWLQDPAEWLVLAFVIVSLVFGLIMELAHIPSWEKETWGPFASQNSDVPWEMKMRSIMVAVYIAFVVATGIALLVIIGDTETFGRANEDA